MEMRSGGVVAHLQIDVRHKVDAEVVGELFEALDGVEDTLITKMPKPPISRGICHDAQKKKRELLVRACHVENCNHSIEVALG